MTIVPGGLHLIVDAEAARGLDDRDLVPWFLHEAARLANVRIVGSQVALLPTGVPTGPGITALAMLSASHASIHTAPECGRVSFDFYSCFSFDWKAIDHLFKETFEVTKILEHHVLPRAEFPFSEEWR